MRKWSEAEILKGVNIQEQEAVKQLFDMFWVALSFLAIELLGKDLPEKQIPQSVFIRLLRKKRRFENFGDLQDFLYGSVRTICLKLVRQERASFNMFAEMKIKKDGDRHILITEVLRIKTFSTREI